jgi:hypothetical protein
MSFDSDSILEMAAARRPGLVEVARGRARVLVWWTGRVWGAVRGARVTIDRELGTMGDPIDFPAAEIARLARFTRWWERERHRWSAFYFSCAGFPGGYGGATYHWRPGRRSEPRQIGRETIGGRSGFSLKGREALRAPTPCSSPLRVAHDLWRVGEAVGAPSGERVGVVARLGGLELRVRRQEIEIRRGRRRLFLEEDEGAFLRALARRVR